MLARRLQGLLAFELLAYALLIALAIGTERLSGWQAMSGIVLLALALRTVATALLFILSHRYADKQDPEAGLSVGSGLRLFLAEWLALSQLYSALQVFPRHRAVTEPVTGDIPPLLLVHGYACNEGFWRPLLRSLEAQGNRPLETLNLEPVFGDLDSHVEQLNTAIEALCLRSQARTITILAHSMGGLVARRYLQRYGANRVDRLILLGTPHHGTGLAYWGLGRNARQMEPDSPWLQTLNRVPTPVPIFNLYSRCDTIVSPRQSALLPPAPNHHNIPVGAVGHLEMAFNRQVRAHIQAVLEA
ncbi:lipase family alpha/beta hydrolase [Saccharospirillum salsuginis]|uniref:Lipase n=1 Tax=Saccharospirillum salsuginis TaxID=418750 RepID=A0A918N9Z6_9GAMM|nr:alpha/beta fold hydrolase [Saccharospirillum salsuginis]GGX52399.1 lipase [Saccharospirillum salsuginis]